LDFRLKARLDIAEAVGWYSERGKSLGADFARTIEDTLTAIADNPHQYQRIRGEVRRAVLTRFPYSLLYTCSDDAIVVMRCFHHRRNPRRWMEGP
jgi:plasmid stabilization system protein ParE